jgi:hypothetical protein
MRPWAKATRGTKTGEAKTREAKTRNLQAIVVDEGPAWLFKLAQNSD